MDNNKTERPRLYSAERRKERVQFYASPAWYRIKKRVFKKQGRLCEFCLKKRPKRLSLATVVDHADGWDTLAEARRGPWNVLCKECHRLKTSMDLSKLRKRERLKWEFIDV